MHIWMGAKTRLSHDRVRGRNQHLVGGDVADLEEVYKPSVASQRPVVLEGLPQDGAWGDAQGQIWKKRGEKPLKLL